jgi:hypothetical protein
LDSPSANSRTTVHSVRVRFAQPCCGRNVPVLTINPRDSRPAWQQVTATLTEAIRSAARLGHALMQDGNDVNGQR